MTQDGMREDRTILGAAIVGLGWWGRHICTSLYGSELVRIVHGVDPNLAAAGPFAREHGFPLSADLADALRDDRVEAVLLATPHSQHEAQIVAAAETGRHVFCEKPLTLTRAGAERAVAACTAAGVTLSVGHERRFEPPIMALKRLVDDDRLGALLLIEANYGHNMLAAIEPTHWRASAAESPGAGLTGIGSHLIDIYTHVFGRVTSVRALSARRVTQRAGGDVLTVQFTFASGAYGTLNNVSASPFYGRLTVFGSKAWAESRARAHMQAGGVTELEISPTVGERSVEEWEPVDTVRANVEAFAAAALGRAPNTYSAEQMIHAVAVLEAIVTSIGSGRVEPVL